MLWYKTPKHAHCFVMRHVITDVISYHICMQASQGGWSKYSHHASTYLTAQVLVYKLGCGAKLKLGFRYIY